MFDGDDDDVTVVVCSLLLIESVGDDDDVGVLKITLRFDDADRLHRFIVF